MIKSFFDQMTASWQDATVSRPITRSNRIDTDTMDDNIGTWDDPEYLIKVDEHHNFKPLPRPSGIIPQGNFLLADNDGESIIIKKEPPKKKKVAIVGFAPASLHHVPYDDPDTEIWGLNDVYVMGMKRWDRWFQFHTYEALEIALQKGQVRDKNHLKWMATDHGKPIYYLDKTHPKIANSIPYPLQAVKDEFGDYFNNSISFMIALAVQEGFEEIGIYGVDMATESEYADQRPSCEYMIGVARGRGIKVIIPEECDLLKCSFLYGFEEAKQKGVETKWNARKKELDGRLEGLKKKQAQIIQNKANVDAEINYISGALENQTYIINNWSQ